MADRFAAWVQALEARHLADLRFAEVTRALRALSSTYVERRGTLARGAALKGTGKRAAFALFYGPLHFLLVREVVRAIGAAATDRRPIVDLGCGTGVAGCAWALEFEHPSRVVGVERHPWAVSEAEWTYRTLGLHARVVRNEVTRHRLPGKGAGVIAAFLLNELSPEAAERLLDSLLGAARRGASGLVVEPLARAATPGWPIWQAAVEAAGGRADEWRVELDLPDVVRRLGRAAGLDPREATARTLYLPG